MLIYSIGHSTRSIQEFMALLEAHEITAVDDVRAFPASRRNPQFSRENLVSSLSMKHIDYQWMGKELGGFRREIEGLGDDSPNKAWKTEGFRIYADYMLTEAFKSAAARLIDLAGEKKAAYMCAEKFYWRCHRRLISDYLVTRGHEVWHIIEGDRIQEHKLTEFAQVKDGRLTYPLPLFSGQ